MVPPQTCSKEREREYLTTRTHAGATSDAVESKLEQLAKEHGRKDYIVFYCMYGQLRSPAAALSLIKALGTSDAASQGNNVYASAATITAPALRLAL